MDSQIIVISRQELDQWKQSVINELRQLIREETSTSNDSKTWLSEQEAQKYLNVGRTTLYKYRKGGTIPFTQRGRKISYRLRDLNKFLNDNASAKSRNDDS